MSMRDKKEQHFMRRLKNNKTLLSLAVCSSLGMAQGAIAQETQDDEEDQIEIIEVTGIADSFRNAIAEKRNADVIVDALSSADIGALPDLSVAETLERITGVTGDRFKGNSSEISIRGLGPFLGFSTVNGRAISSGSGNRSVAFSQFPSELVNGVVVYKSQKADLLEGGVSGVIDLKTIRPLDYGKERFQAEVKASHTPYHDRYENETGLGVRTSLSYTNFVETDDWGDFGFAIGMANVDQPIPEESYNTSSTLRNCNSDFGVDGGSNCSFRDGNAGAANGDALAGDFYFIPNSFFYRQMESEEDRDAAIMALQWQPTPDIDINLDGQWSNRLYYEDRHDLLWDDGRRRIANWVTTADGALVSYTGESRISSYGERRIREEDYVGGGLNVAWQVSNNLELSADVAYSGTDRYQTRTYARFRGQRKFYDWQNNGPDNWPTVNRVYSDFNDPTGSEEDWLSDIQDLSYFNADSEARYYRFDISDTINSYRFDASYALDEGFFSALNAGVALSSHRHQNWQEERQTIRTPSGDRPAVIAEATRFCSEDFPVDGFGDDANSNLSSWAIFDIQCGYDTIVGDTEIDVDPTTPSAGDINLKEEIQSIYFMANFSSEIGEMPLDGNIGIRHVTTDITSLGTKTAIDVVTDQDGFIELIENDEITDISVLENSYSNLLPSINASLGLTDELQLRAAYYAGISRPDMWYFGAGRDIGTVGSDEEFTNLAEALEGRVTARGNPFLEALESDNYDLSLSYYLDEDTLISGALYYKTFNARFDIEDGIEPIIIDGQSVNVLVDGRPTVIDEDSSINGYELTVTHKLNWAPEPFDGIGFSLNYNFANSDFETPENGSNVTTEVEELIVPANIAGLSRHTFSGQLYWEYEDISARISYKFRDEYLKPFGPNLAQTNRFVEDTRRVDFDARYKLTKNLQLRVQALNITNEPYVEQRVARSAYNRIEYTGPIYFIGVRLKY